MAKFKFVKRPESVAHTVRAKDIDGKDLALKVEYRYRSRSEFAELIGSTEVEDSDDAKLADVIAAFDSRGAELILEALVSWDLEEELNLDNARLIIDKYQPIASAIVSDYRKLCLEGRLGN